MDSPHDQISKAACDLASDLPMDSMQIAAKSISDSTSPAKAQERIARDVPHPYYRERVITFVQYWHEHAPGVSPQAVAMALLAAAHSEQAHRRQQSVELVWTGPDTGEAPFRRTEQAILQVLDSAQKRITLVSYAVYRIPYIQEALVKAAQRGVKITVIVETPDKLEGQNEYSTLQALGDNVASCSTVYYWPQENRPTNGPKIGILHVKCAVADSRQLFLSSANLTEHAFTINMELGVLLTGGYLPMQIEAHFDRLISTGVLEKV